VRNAYFHKFNTLSWRGERRLTDHPNITDPETLRRYYADVAITASYFTNTLSSNNTSIALNVKNLGHPTDRQDWHDSYAVAINTFYAWELNQIVFLAGIVQPPWLAMRLAMGLTKTGEISTARAAWSTGGARRFL